MGQIENPNGHFKSSEVKFAKRYVKESGFSSSLLFGDSIAVTKIENIFPAKENSEAIDKLLISPENHEVFGNKDGRVLTFLAIKSLVSSIEINAGFSLNLKPLPANVLKNGFSAYFQLENAIFETIKFLDKAQHWDLSVYRRLSLACLKARKEEYWFWYNYVRSLRARPNFLLRGIKLMTDKFPQNISQTMLLLDCLNQGKLSREAVAFTLIDAWKNKTTQIIGWGFVVFARKFNQFVGAKEALELFDEYAPLREEKSLRLQVLLVKTEILRDLYNIDPSFRDSLIKALTSLVFLDPMHVTAAKNVELLCDLHREVLGSKQVFGDVLNFLSHQKSVMTDSIDQDLNFNLINEFIDAEWIEDAAIAHLKDANYKATQASEIVVEETTKEISGPLFWDEFNNEPPVKYATFAGRFNSYNKSLCRYDLCNVFYMSANALSVVMDAKSGRVIREASSGRANFFSGQKPSIVDTSLKDKKIFAIVLGYGDDNYCHFLLDRIPLLSDINSSGIQYDCIIIEEKLANMCRQFVDYIGIDIPVVALKQNVFYEFDSISIFTSPQHPGQNWPNKFRGFFDKIPAKTLEKRKKIFIVRPQGRRGIANQEEIHNIALDAGFELIKLEQLSISQQIEAFRNAEFVAGVHGAGFSNIIYSPSDTKVLELARSGYMTASFSITAGCLGMPYACLIDESANDSHKSDATTKFYDLYIDPEKFRKIVKSLDEFRA